MAWTTPRTWAALEKVTAALLNTHLRDNLNYLYGIQSVQRLSTNITPASNTSTTETDLMSYTVAGGTLSANGMGVDLVAFGTTANNANTKTLKFYVGGTAVLEADLAVSGEPWLVRAHLVRLAATTLLVRVDATGVLFGEPAVAYASQTITLASNCILKVTGQSSSASSDITQTHMSVRLVP